MECTIPVEITPHAVAKLVLQNEITLSDSWTEEQSRSVIQAIALLSIEEIINTIDTAETPVFSTDNIPQFGSVVSLARVPQYVLQEGVSGLNYAQLGFRLKNDVYARMDANIKYGENHGKGAALLGLICLCKKRFYPSVLTTGFCRLDDDKIRNDVIIRLFFRIPIVQTILKEAKTHRINGYCFMKGMKMTTQKRRGQCLRAIFREFGSLDNPVLSERICNVFWETDELEGIKKC